MNKYQTDEYLLQIHIESFLKSKNISYEKYIEYMDKCFRGYGPKASHPAKEIMFNGQSIMVDVEILPLIEKIWEASIKTTACCQGDINNPAYIAFPTKSDIIKFVELYPISEYICKFVIIIPYESARENVSILDIKNTNDNDIGTLFSIYFEYDVLHLFIEN